MNNFSYKTMFIVNLMLSSALSAHNIDDLDIDLEVCPPAQNAGSLDIGPIFSEIFIALATIVISDIYNFIFKNDQDKAKEAPPKDSRPKPLHNFIRPSNQSLNDFIDPLPLNED